MAYKHRVDVTERPTSVLPPVSVSAGIPFIVGTAPVNMADAANVNKPVLCYSYAEAVAAFGYVPAKQDGAVKKFEYSISEFINSQFALFGCAPVIIVNVLDPATHKTAATTTAVTLNAATGAATIAETGILPDTVELSNAGTPYVKGTDYELSFDADGGLVITSLVDGSGNFKCATGTELKIGAQKVDPSAVDEDDIIGGVDGNGKASGLELVGECFPRFRLVPGLILAPGYSHNPGVAAVMAAKAANINNLFSAIALVDAPTDTVTQYSGVPEWKNTNNIADPLQVVCWPKCSLDGVVYHMSTQLAGVICKTDSENDDVPSNSPSNHNYQMTAAVLDDGSEVWLSPDSAEYLNGQGVVTALNFIGGWKCWGNRTACYPANTDVKDAFIVGRRMFSWVRNSLIQTYWPKLDAPLKLRQVETIVDSANIWMNGLTAKEYILGGRVEFRETENDTASLMDGIAVFSVSFAYASPNRYINFTLEYDASYIATLFG